MNFINDSNGCNLCRIKLFKTLNGHLNSVKHRANLKKYKKIHNLLPHDEENPSIADLQEMIYIIEKLNKR